ncbi:hypothetical protein FB446DRAFT_771141 [Lentinula raphanica]|nr:hypothetical protein FB446DRAFT_771141 [Lentinula raphanica]
MIQIKRTVVDNEPDPKHLFLYHCIFNPCPALTQLSVFNAWTTRTPFDYSRLTSLKLSVFEGSSLSTLLSRCPCLQSLSLEECHILRLDNPGSESEPFFHQSITTLILPTYFPNRFHDVAWADVRFPNLDTLHIIESREGGFQALLDMLIESKCNLQTMKLGELPEKSFRELLAIAPSLKFLTLDSYYLSCITNLHRVFRPLYGTASGTPVPDLCSLKVEIFPSHWRLDLDLVRKARSEPRNQPYPYPAGPAPTLEDADRAAVDSDPEYSGSSSSEPTSDADSEAANESESDDTDSDARSEAEPEADSGAANSNTDETVSDNSSEADSEADSHTPDLQAMPGADSDSVNWQEEMMTALTEKPQYIAGAFVLLEHLRLMMVSRRKDPTLVRITPKPYVNPPPFDDNADVITQLPAYLLAVDDLGMDVLALVVVELYWNTTLNIIYALFLGIARSSAVIHTVSHHRCIIPRQANNKHHHRATSLLKVSRPAWGVKLVALICHLSVENIQGKSSLIIPEQDQKETIVW